MAPTIAIIPGAWQNPDNYGPLRAALSARGFESVCLSPPSIHDGAADLAADATFVREHVLGPLLSQGKDVLVVTHSFGGVYGGAALQGLEKKEPGGQAGVLGVVYVASACVPSGKSALQVLGIGEELPDWVRFDEATGLLSLVDPVALMFHALPAEEARAWAAKMQTQAILPMRSAVAYAPFEDPAWKGKMAYLMCGQDNTIHPKGQKMFLGINGVEVTDEIATGHMPWLEKADETADKILGLAKRVNIL